MSDTKPTNAQIATMTQDQRRDETWRSFADHVLETCRKEGAVLVVLGSAKPMFVEIEGDSLVAWPADPDDWAAGGREPVSSVSARAFLGRWLEHARLVRDDEDANEVVREMELRRAGRVAVAEATETKRAEYLRGELTHDEYYGQLVELFGESALRALLPGHRTSAQWAELVQEDRHLNNVPLRSWDVMHSSVRRLGVDRDALVAITGTGGWSLSDSVCVLKTAARRCALTA